jgi:hypothetical protein
MRGRKSLPLWTTGAEEGEGLDVVVVMGEDLPGGRDTEAEVVVDTTGVEADEQEEVEDFHPRWKHGGQQGNVSDVGQLTTGFVIVLSQLRKMRRAKLEASGCSEAR